MKLKEFVILAVIIVLLGAYLLFHGNDRSQYRLPELSPVAAKDISRLTLTSAGKTIQLVQKENTWKIGDNAYPADSTKMEAILSALEGLRLTALVSEAKAYPRYDLSDDKKITVQAWKGETLVRTLDIGKEAETYQHTFVRIGEDPNVYQAQSSFREAFDQTEDSLRDKTVLSFTPADIKQIDVTSEGASLSLALKDTPATEPTAGKDSKETAVAKTEAVWMAGGKEKKTEEVSRLLAQLAHLSCDHYLSGKQASDFKDPIRTITLTGKEATTLSIFKKGEGETAYPAVSTQTEYPFALSESAYTRMTESLTPLMKEETEEKKPKE
jgi:hypothetical protein